MPEPVSLSDAPTTEIFPEPPVKTTDVFPMVLGAIVMVCVSSATAELIAPTVIIPMPVLSKPTVALSNVRE